MAAASGVRETLLSSLKKAIKSTIPAPIFHIVRDIPFILSDILAKKATGDCLIPPRRLMFDGPRTAEAFKTSGAEALHFYKNIANISPDSFMLDIGSGIGRKTIPLLSFLSRSAMYVGIDINTSGIDWCLRNITKKNNRFMFFPINIYNKFYSPRGAIAPIDLVLPFSDNSFDVVALWSVFTHMYPGDIAHYLSEISRVLKPGGRLVASYYLMNDSALDLVKTGKAGQNICHRGDGYWTTNPNIPEDLIAVDNGWLKSAMADQALSTVETYYGKWSGNSVDPEIGQLNYQDIVVAQKRL